MMDDLHNMSIDVLKCYIKTRDEGNFPKKDYPVSTIIELYFKFDQHPEHEIEIGKTIVQQWKLAEVMAGGILDLDFAKARSFLTEYETDEYILDRCFDTLAKEDDGIYRIFSYLLDRQKIKIDDSRVKVLEAGMRGSDLVEFKQEGYNYSYVLKAKGILALANYDTFSNYQQQVAAIIQENNGMMHTPLVADDAYVSKLPFEMVVDFIKQSISEKHIPNDKASILVVGIDDEVFIRTTDGETKEHFDIIREEMIVQSIDLDEWHDILSRHKMPEKIFGNVKLARFRVGF